MSKILIYFGPQILKVNEYNYFISITLKKNLRVKHVFQLILK